jgi:predicted nuclease of restriction endonuclease-like (RecB) superfamily
VASNKRGKLPARPDPDSSVGDAGYGELLEGLKTRIRDAQIRATLAVNQGLLSLYWQIGREILIRQQVEGWGTRVIDRLAADLRREFPEMTGFSRTNLKYMRSLAEAYPGNEIGQQAVGQIPWGHNIVLLTLLKDPEERLWYAGQSVEHGWSRAVLVHQIESGIHARQGQAITNFERTLPRPHSDLARDLLRDPYNFGFLGLGTEVRERELERALVAHVRDFLLELGVGFAFVSSQYRLEVEEREYRLDLLFYHLRLRCFVVIELKVGPFEPEYAGKMNFYLAAVDDQLRKESDQPSIGLILCKERNRVVVEYALRGTNQPIGVAAYRLTETLPQALRGAIPSPEELQRELRESTHPDE